jgi:hypothetical protein
MEVLSKLTRTKRALVAPGKGQSSEIATHTRLGDWRNRQRSRLSTRDFVPSTEQELAISR